MRMGFGLLFAVAGLVLAGCAHEPHALGPTPCADKECFVKVSVADCKIVVDPEERYIAKGNKSPVIKWEMDAGSAVVYGFPEKAIVFPEGREQFQSPERSSFGGSFMVVDRNDAAGKFKYGITVRNRWSGEPCPTLDPFVINGG